MEDRELLEAAAKAAGMKTRPFATNSATLWHERGERDMVAWNPLTDDADLHRLAVALRITLDFRAVSDSIPAAVIAMIPRNRQREAGASWVNVAYVPDAMLTNGNDGDAKFARFKLEEPGMVRGLEEATRRAIVRAAAAMCPREPHNDVAHRTL